MSQYDPKAIEEYQLILLKNPRSPVFAALAEAYRKMGLIDEALEVTQRGIKHNPEFVSGLVAHAKILLDLKNYTEALVHLKKAHALKPENILALRLMAILHIKLKEHQKALVCQKKLLILNPNDEEALTFLKKWEFLESSESQSSVPVAVNNLEDWMLSLPDPDLALHAIDSFLNQQDLESAEALVVLANDIWRGNTEVRKRLALLRGLNPEQWEEKEQTAQKLHILAIKKSFYKNLLQRIEQMKAVDPHRQP